MEHYTLGDAEWLDENWVVAVFRGFHDNIKDKEV
jgi:hypothetical protein